MDLQERIEKANKTYFRLQTVFGNKNISRKPKLRPNNTIIYKTLTYASETWVPTKKDRKQINIFERKVHRRILAPPPPYMTMKNKIGDH
jgi:reverse gyrase